MEKGTVWPTDLVQCVCKLMIHPSYSFGKLTTCLFQGLVWAKIQKRRAKEASANVTPMTTTIVKTPLLVLEEGRNVLSL